MGFSRTEAEEGGQVTAVERNADDADEPSDERNDPPFPTEDDDSDSEKMSPTSTSVGSLLPKSTL